MRRHELRPSTHRPDERPPPGAITIGSVFLVAVLLLLAVSPLLVVSAAVISPICAKAAHEYR